jgi:hypothetical protein
MSPYQEGQDSKQSGHDIDSCPYGKIHYQYREERIEQQVHKAQWIAGYEGKEDPYSAGWAA